MSAGADGGFNVRVIAAVIIAGIVGFIGYWALSAFAPELGSGKDGGAHALSSSATGFTGVAALLREAGHPVSIARSPDSGVPGGDQSHFGGLLVLTPSPRTPPADIVERLGNVTGPVLIVLPKYVTSRSIDKPEWVMKRGMVDRPEDPVQISDWSLAPTAELSGFGGVDTRVSLWQEESFRLAMDAPQLLSVRGSGISPMLTVNDHVILAQVSGREDTYILSDPDFINNLAIRDDVHATSAVTLLSRIAGPGEPIAFDVTLNGLGANSQSLLRLAFVPPFLGLTLCLIIAGLLALWQGFVRFGPPWREERNVAFGKAGLVANGARLIVQARRVTHFASRYGAMVREAAARRLHAPPGLAGQALDQWLDRFADQRGQRFSTLLARLETAGNPVDIVRHAAALGQWRKDVLRESE